MKGYLILENGKVFEGEKIGYDKKVTCKITFSTAMVGHTEVFQESKFKGKGLCMTYPLIGNYGTITPDNSKEELAIEAVFIQEMDEEKDYRTEMTLNNLLIKNKVPGLKKINTRELTKIIRNQEGREIKGMLTTNIDNIENIIKNL